MRSTDSKCSPRLTFINGFSLADSRPLWATAFSHISLSRLRARDADFSHIGRCKKRTWRRVSPLPTDAHRPTAVSHQASVRLLRRGRLADDSGADWIGQSYRQAVDGRGHGRMRAG